MKLTQDQIKITTKYLKLLAEGKSKTAAAEAVDVPRKTIARWVEADNAPVVDNGKTKVTVPKAKVTNVTKTVEPEVKVPTTDEYVRLVKIVSGQLWYDSYIEYGSRFVEDLGADSLDLVELVMALEDEFEQEIPDIDAEKLFTVKDAYEYIMKKLGNPIGVQIDVKEAAKKVPAEAKIDRQVPFQSISLPNVFTIVRDGAPLQIDKSHQNFAKIKEIIATVKDGKIWSSDLEKLHDLIDLKSSLAKFSHGRITVDDTGVKVDGKPLHNELATVMIRSMKDGDMEGLSRFAKFHEKVMEALSYKVTNRLFNFITKTGLKIDDDGDIIALKVVQHNYLDCHSGTFDNSPGKTVSMPRNEVDDDDTKTCRPGLHVCAPGYISSFANRSGGNKLVEVKVDPRDIVSIPTDYNADKCRACKYVVLRDVSSSYKKELYNT